MCERVSTLLRDALAVEIPSGSVGAARLQRAVVRSEGGTRSREFLFDRTFGPGAAQARARTAAAGVLHAVPPTLRAGRNPRTRMQDDVYGDVGGPIVADVLNGCNGTVFAYGQVRCAAARGREWLRATSRGAQTGSGKTYTMGILRRVNDEHAGLIPRALSHIFGARWRSRRFRVSRSCAVCLSPRSVRCLCHSPPPCRSLRGASGETVVRTDVVPADILGAAAGALFCAVTSKPPGAR